MASRVVEEDDDADFQADLARAIAASLEPDAGPHEAPLPSRGPENWRALLAASQAKSSFERFCDPTEKAAGRLPLGCPAPGQLGGRSSPVLTMGDDDDDNGDNEDDFRREIEAALAASLESAEEEQRRRQQEGGTPGAAGVGAALAGRADGAAPSLLLLGAHGPAAAPAGGGGGGAAAAVAPARPQEPGGSPAAALCCSRGLMLKPLAPGSTTVVGRPADAPPAPVPPAAAPVAAPGGALPHPRALPAALSNGAGVSGSGWGGLPVGPVVGPSPSPSRLLSSSPAKHARSPSLVGPVGEAGRPQVKRSRPSSDSGAAVPPAPSGPPVATAAAPVSRAAGSLCGSSESGVHDGSVVQGTTAAAAAGQTAHCAAVAADATARFAGPLGPTAGPAEGGVRGHGGSSSSSWGGPSSPREGEAVAEQTPPERPASAASGCTASAGSAASDATAAAVVVAAVAAPDGPLRPLLDAQELRQLQGAQGQRPHGEGDGEGDDAACEVVPGGLSGVPGFWGISAGRCGSPGPSPGPSPGHPRPHLPTCASAAPAGHLPVRAGCGAEREGREVLQVGPELPETDLVGGGHRGQTAGSPREHPESTEGCSLGVTGGPLRRCSSAGGCSGGLGGGLAAGPPSGVADPDPAALAGGPEPMAVDPPPLPSRDPSTVAAAPPASPAAWGNAHTAGATGTLPPPSLPQPSVGYSGADRRLLLHQRVWFWLGPGRAQLGRVATIDRRSEPLLYTVRLDPDPDCTGSTPATGGHGGDTVMATADCLLPYLAHGDLAMCRLAVLPPQRQEGPLAGADSARAGPPDRAPVAPAPWGPLGTGGGAAAVMDALAAWSCVPCGWREAAFQHCVFEGAVPMAHVQLGGYGGEPYTLPYEYVVPVRDVAEGSGCSSFATRSSPSSSAAGVPALGSGFGSGPDNTCMDIVPVGPAC